MKYILLEEVDSTNSYVSLHAPELEDMTVVAAATQTAGRGQRGNSWESEPGANLTLTLLHRPAEMPARSQFAISEATALAVADTLRQLGVEAMVKWPNDIYVGDRKIAGILIEHSVMGAAVEHSRIGIGLNVNQRRFLSDAPNPVSVVQLTGEELSLTDLLPRLGESLRLRLQEAASPEGRTRLHEEFLARLWRRDGALHPFRRRDGGEVFQARIAGVEPEGFLLLLPEGAGAPERFAFKEVEFLLPSE